MGKWRAEGTRLANVEPLPDGANLGLGAYVLDDSDFTAEEAVARLRAAFRGRDVWALPIPRDRTVAVVARRGLVFLVEQPQAIDERRRADIRRACAVPGGFRGVTVVDLGQGDVVHRPWRG